MDAVGRWLGRKDAALVNACLQALHDPAYGGGGVARSDGWTFEDDKLLVMQARSSLPAPHLKKSVARQTRADMC